MPRRFILKVVKVSYTPNAPYMVRVPARLLKLEGVKKRFFAKESVAKAYAERLARLLGEYHLQALGLSDVQKIEAFECYQRLEKCNATLRDAVAHYVTYLETANQSARIGTLFDEFLGTKQQDGLSSKYIADLRSKLGRFAKAFRGTLACDLTAAGLETWIRNLELGSVSRESYRRNIAVMLEFGRRRGYLRVNPAKDVKITRRPEGEVSVLSSNELSKLLDVCAPSILPYVTICAFAGLRPSEAANLDWAHIHWETMQIEVKARHSKTRRYRLVPILSNLAAWLQPLHKESGSIGYSRRRFREAYQAAGITHWKMEFCGIRMELTGCRY